MPLVVPTPTVPLPSALQRSGIAESAPNRQLTQQAAQPTLAALSVQRALFAEVQAERGQLQRQADEAAAALPPDAEQRAVQRACDSQAPAVPAFYATPPQQRARQHPNFSDVADLYRFEAAGVMQTDNGRGPLSAPLRAIQRRAVGEFARAYRAAPAAPVQRMAQLGQALATVQRAPFGGEVAAVVTGRTGGLPAGDLPMIQRALHDANAGLAQQEQHDQGVQHLHALQRQLADHETKTDQQHVMQRVRARQGGGEALPASVQRQLEAGLNADLSKVRLHTDGEADQLARGVGAKAFTSGQDIYFRAGHHQPHSHSGRELLAHEATHTVQQARGQVRLGLDPDAGLEVQAQQMGAKLARRPTDKRQAKTIRRRSSTATPAAVQRAPAPTPTPKPPTKILNLDKLIQAFEDAVRKLDRAEAARRYYDLPENKRGQILKQLIEKYRAQLGRGMEPGKLDRPGRMGWPHYFGIDAHNRIGNYYARMHRNQQVFLNTKSVEAIARELFNRPLNSVERQVPNVSKQPDIVNTDLKHIWEIKPREQIGTADAQLAMYMAAFAKLGAPVVPGPVGDPGANGMVGSAGGWLVFKAVKPGVIMYEQRKQRPREQPATVPQTQPEAQPAPQGTSPQTAPPLPPVAGPSPAPSGGRGESQPKPEEVGTVAVILGILTYLLTLPARRLMPLGPGPLRTLPGFGPTEPDII